MAGTLKYSKAIIKLILHLIVDDATELKAKPGTELQLLFIKKPEFTALSLGPPLPQPTPALLPCLSRW